MLLVSRVDMLKASNVKADFEWLCLSFSAHKSWKLKAHDTNGIPGLCTVCKDHTNQNTLNLNILDEGFQDIWSKIIRFYSILGGVAMFKTLD